METLEDMIESGDLFIDSQTGEVWGIAADGKEVSLGYSRNDKERQQIEVYLRDHPTPETW